MNTYKIQTILDEYVFIKADRVYISPEVVSFCINKDEIVAAFPWSGIIGFQKDDKENA